MCDDCEKFRTNRDHISFDLKCLYCGARIIQTIQRLRVSPNSRAERCRTVLKDWVAFGHDESEIRRRAKLPEAAIAPEQHKKVKAKK